ncbi:alpha-1-acid glycoprotein 1-like isoform X2 [Haemorhous mexicanus]|uniref:alpha-1-acid glycoprotein 1-like isoform X2 n=1 Tax=Haemorhous mexicanus TaxID=30427 RepID=UPI0028BD70DD|nr:alpha-1-acid glycoprotein 1-like isoform X2 [Haemorhous mexicanus]
MLATLTLLLGLPLALATQSCAPLVPVTFNSTTIPQLLGQWFYIAGASRYPPHLAELRAVTFEAFSFSPGSHEDELNITEIIRMNETCVVRNSSKIQVFQQNSTLVHVDDNGVVSTARLIQSDKDLLIVNHINIDSPNLSLSGITQEQSNPKTPFPSLPFHFPDSTDPQREQGAHGGVQSPPAVPGLH